MDPVRHPAAFCKIHGIFPATAFALGPGSSVTIEGCTTNCPRCNSDSEILNGTYTTFQDRMDVLLGPGVSAEALAAIRAIVEAVRDEKISEVEARKQVEKIVPGSGRLFDIADWSGGAKATLFASIISAMAVIAAAKITASSAPNITINPVVERVIEMPPKRRSLPGLPGGPSLRSKPKKHR